MKKLLSVVLLSLVLGAVVGCNKPADEAAPAPAPDAAAPATNAPAATP